MRVFPVLLSFALASSLSLIAQDAPPTPPKQVMPQSSAPPAIVTPQKDETANPAVPQTPAQKASQQGTPAQPDAETHPQPSAQPQQQPNTTPQAGNPAAPGASAPTAANTIQRNVRLVVLDAVVVDRQGNSVNDLRKEEFHVTESDEPQQIRDFETPGKYALAPNVTINSTADLDRLAPRAPVNIVLLDEFNTRFEDMAFARYSLQKWLKKQPDKLDTPTMLIAVSLQKFEVLHDYTQDKQAILSSLDHHFVAYPWQMHQFAWVPERYATAHLTLRRVAEAVTGHQGHKNMIWIGRGFPTFNRSRVAIDDQNRINWTVQLTVNELRDARVTLYTIDPAGVMVNPGEYGWDAAMWAPFGGDPDFQSLARATGGRNLYGRNDVDAQIGTSIRDGASIYALTYRPTDLSRDYRKFRKINVTVDRPGLSVITRQGYFLDTAPARLNKDNEPNRRLMTELLSAESSNMVYDAVPFTVKPAGTEPDSYLIHIEPSGLVWTYATATEPRQTKLILLVTTFDKKGKELKRDGKSMIVKAPANAPPTGRIEIPVQIPYKLQADSKAVRARFVVRVDLNGRMGTADLPLGQAGVSATSHATPPADANTQPPPSPAEPKQN